MLFVRDLQTAFEHELLYTVFHRMTQVFRVNCITYNEVYKLSDNLSHNTIYCFLARTKYMRQRVILLRQGNVAGSLLCTETAVNTAL